MSRKSWDDLFCPARPETTVLADGSAVWLAPAKLNLSLRVVARRADGYHQLDSVAAKVTLYDELTFRRRHGEAVHLQCTGFDCGSREDNLVLQAAELLCRRGGAFGADIQLSKHIPPGAGLGGGSSDAATTLKALNRMWKLDLPARELSALATELGSDIPLFLDGPAVRMRDRGEWVEPLRMRPFHALVYLPDLRCPTGQVYAAYDALEAETPRPETARGAEGSLWESLLSAGYVDQRPSRWREELVNDLEAAAAKVEPELAGIIQRLEAAIGQPVRMTGSGSAVFALLDEEGQARRVLGAVPEGMKERCRVVLLNSW